jgi:low temperature requirement protein LtrA
VAGPAPLGFCDSPVMTNPAAEERHATWLELFFDLVVVAAVAQLAHLLREGPGIAEVFLFAVLYYAMWSVWTSFTLYANVAGALTRQRAMLIAMFGIAVMAAAVPHVLRGEPRVFIVAYVVCRMLAAGSWKRTSRVITEWPGAQQAAGVVPWFASLGFEPPARYWLWVLGIVLDIGLSVLRSRNPRALLDAEQRERDRERRKRQSRGQADPRAALPPLAEAHPDRPHLGERLGLFVIIVLGEAVAQIVNSAANVPEWDRALWAGSVFGFGLLVALWWLTLQYGSTAAPTYGVRVFPLRLTLPAHFLTTSSIVAIAAGLGALTETEKGRLPEAARWVLCAGAALYFLTSTVSGARGGATRRWIFGWGIPAVVVSVLLGLLGGPLPGWALAGAVLLIALWHVRYRRRAPVPSAVPQQD